MTIAAPEELPSIETDGKESDIKDLHCYFGEVNKSGLLFIYRKPEWRPLD